MPLQPVLLLLLAINPAPFQNLFFEPNHGQAAATARYIARIPGANIAITNDGVLLQSGSGQQPVHLRLPNTNPSARLEPLEESPSTTSYFLGADPSKWTRDVPHYKKLAWRNVYPGIDLIFYGHDGRLEYDFILAPGANPALAQFEVDRPARFALKPTGDLEILNTAFEFKKPTIYQRDNQGHQHRIEGRYRVRSHGAKTTFELAAYDHHRELVIDPVVTVASYYGGESNDSVVAITPQGDIVGTTSSLSFTAPTSTAPRRGKDVFAVVSRIDSTTPSLFYFFGGSDDDVATSAASNRGFLVIGGWTRSTDFITTGGYGGEDGFLLHFPRSLAANPTVTRIGGSGDDRINALSTGGFYFAGETTSTDLTYTGADPTKQPTAATPFAGGVDAMLGAVSPNNQYLTVLSVDTFGGSGDDRAYSIAPSSVNGAIIAGKTTSPDLPFTTPMIPYLSGPSDGFIAAVTRVGDVGPKAGTYLGGSGNDEIRAITTIRSATGTDVFFAGVTNSTDFPLMNPAQSAYGGGDTDAFAGRLALDAGQLVFSTYIGGSGDDEANAITYGMTSLAVDPIVVGSTTSGDLPVVNPVQSSLNGSRDAMVAYINGDGTMGTLTYYGGSGAERAKAVWYTPGNIVMIGGETDSADLPMPASTTSAKPFAGGIDGFVAGLGLGRFAVLGYDSERWTAKDLRFTQYISLSTEYAPTTQISVSSSDPTTVLVALDPASAGDASVTMPLSSLTGTPNQMQFYVIGAADSGEATVTISVEGHDPVPIRVRVGAPVIRLNASSGNHYIGDNVPIYGYLGVLNEFGTFQAAVSRSGAPSIPVDLVVSDPSIGSLISASFTFDAAYLAGIPQTYFVSTNSGDVTITGASPGPAVLPLDLHLAVPQYTLGDLIVGKNIAITTAFSSAYRPGSFVDDITLTSSDPSLVCVAISAGPCGGSVTVNTAYNYFTVRGYADSGSVTLTYSSAKAGSGTATVRLVRPQLSFVSVPSLVAGASATIGWGYLVPGSNGSIVTPEFDPGLTAVSSDESVITVSSVNVRSMVVNVLSAGKATLKIAGDGIDGPVSIPVVATAKP